MLSDIHWYACRANTLKHSGAFSWIVSITWNDEEIVLHIAVLFIFCFVDLFASVSVCACVRACACYFSMLWKANSRYQQSYRGPSACGIGCGGCCFFLLTQDFIRLVGWLYSSWQLKLCFKVEGANNNIQLLLSTFAALVSALMLLSFPFRFIVISAYDDITVHYQPL